MSLVVSKECLASSDPDWEGNPMGRESFFITRAEIPGEGDKIILAMAGNSKFFSKLAEYGHVFVVDPVEDTQGTVGGTDFLSEVFMRQACTDENRRALMTQNGESETVPFINDRDGFEAEFTFRFALEHSETPA